VSCDVNGEDDPIQLHDVRSMIMCDIHFCALKMDNRTVSCSGFVLGYGDYDETMVLNPLTPNVTLTGFTADNKPMSGSIGKSFRNYNVQTLFYERDVMTVFDDNVSALKCADPFSTCVTTGEDVLCFGATDMTFLTDTHSFFLGVGTSTPISVAVLLAARLYLNGDRSGVGFCLAPAVSFLVALLCITGVHRVAIKSMSFLQGGLFGYMWSLVLVYAISQWCTMLRKDMKHAAKVDDEDMDHRDSFEKQLDSDLEDLDASETTLIQPKSDDDDAGDTIDADDAMPPPLDIELSKLN